MPDIMAGNLHISRRNFYSGITHSGIQRDLKNESLNTKCLDIVVVIHNIIV